MFRHATNSTTVVVGVLVSIESNQLELLHIFGDSVAGVKDVK